MPAVRSKMNLKLGMYYAKVIFDLLLQILALYARVALIQCFNNVQVLGTTYRHSLKWFIYAFRGDRSFQRVRAILKPGTRRMMGHKRLTFDLRDDILRFVVVSGK